MLKVFTARSILQVHLSCSLENHIFSFGCFFCCLPSACLPGLKADATRLMERGICFYFHMYEKLRIHWQCNATEVMPAQEL